MALQPSLALNNPIAASYRAANFQDLPMPDIRLAESILALVTTRDRAATTVGDLQEQSETRGAAWFWSGVFRTAASLLWRGFADNALRATGLAFLGVALDGVVAGLCAFLTGIAFLIAAYVTGHAASTNSIPWNIWLVAPTMLASFWIGRLLSRWAIGCELPATVAYIVLAPVVSLLIGLFLPNGPTATQLMPILVAGLAQRLPAIAGAAMARRRQDFKSPVT